MEGSERLSREIAASTASEGRLKHGSNSTAVTAGTADTDWDSYMMVDKPVASLNPWDLYLAFRSAKLLTVEPVIFLYMFANYVFFPLTQQYLLNIYSLQALQNTSYPYLNETRCINRTEVDDYTGSNTTYDHYVDGKATMLSIYASLANRILSVAVTLVMGPISDRYGRRLPMVWVATGSILQGLVMIAIAQFGLNLYFFILGSALAGLSGDMATIFMSSYSYVSDISSGKWRTLRIGLTEGMLFVAGLLAEGLGGLWFQKLDCYIISPVILYLACHATIILYTLLFLPESLTRKERYLKSLNNPRGVRALVRGAGLFCPCGTEGDAPPAWRLWLAIIPMAIFVINMVGAMSVNVFFLSEFDWKPGLIGGYQATMMGSHMLVLLLLLPLLVALRLPDPLVSLLGGLVHCVTYLFIGLSKKTYQLFLSEFLSEQV